MKITIRPVYNRENREDKDGNAPVHIYCRYGNKRRYIHTGVSIPSREWKDGEVVGNINALQLNYKIQKVCQDILGYYLDISRDGEFTEAHLMAFGSKSKPSSFTDFLQKEIDSDNTVVPGTKKYRVRMLQRLKQIYGDIVFSQVDYELIDTYHKSLVKSGLKDSTIYNMHKQLKKFIRIAVNKKLLQDNPYNIYKVKRPVRTQRKCLWYSDLDALWDLTYPRGSIYELVRLKFLFSCYTGLRISDNRALRWDNIREGKIFMTMEKTGQPLTVPLDVLGPRAGEIIQAARGMDDTHVFKKISDQKANATLKRIGLDAGVPFKLHFHVSRHTFCTLIAHKTGSVFDVMRYSGIYKVDTAMVYINLSKLFM